MVLKKGLPKNNTSKAEMIRDASMKLAARQNLGAKNDLAEIFMGVKVSVGF